MTSGLHLVTVKNILMRSKALRGSRHDIRTIQGRLMLIISVSLRRIRLGEGSSQGWIEQRAMQSPDVFRHNEYAIGAQWHHTGGVSKVV